MSTPPENKVTYDAPIGSLDLAAFDERGAAYAIWPCSSCLPWHAEVVVEEGRVLVREWHAVGCPHFRSLLDDDPGG